MLSTPRTRLVLLPPEKADMMAQFYQRNRTHLSPWEPIRPAAFYHEDYWHRALQEAKDLFQQQQAFKFAILHHERDDVIGVCNFTNVIHGAFKACLLGYAADKHYQGQGYMHEAIQAGIRFVFDQVGLHRVMANYIPDNTRSERLLTKLGFEREGYARRYLKINGRWQDHVLTAKLNPSMEE
ncbi:ribosomal protein S5-alanine N-acetyltransferase [Salinivibrio sp. IB872]|uniref:ribosomal protein S5-alanine N-acetyltransferase n=1 Tax=Salinivibrio sp. IB872 TaxID=1766123 RepID=UPI0018E2AA01|nr:ribosomal protein S5-alanine N-acetyltransferase [Salinivibrio sp. IB872]